MRTALKREVTRKAVNISADIDLVRRVREENGNLSALLHESMVAFLKAKELQRWKEENRASFESYDRMIEERGTIAEDMELI